MTESLTDPDLDLAIGYQQGPGRTVPTWSNNLRIQPTLWFYPGEGRLAQNLPQGFARLVGFLV
jgi:hypothetical protein